MDIPRPERARKIRRRRVLLLVSGVLLLCAVTLGLSRLEPAAPTVERSAVWPDTVKRGDMVRQVRGAGTLVPNRIQYIQASSGGRIESILVLPGAKVEPESILIELSNPTLEQELSDAQWQVEAGEADARRREAQIQSDRLVKESALATLESDWKLAEIEAQANERLAEEGLVAVFESKRLRFRANDLKARYENEIARLEIGKKAEEAQLIAQDATLKKQKALVKRKEREVERLVVRAGVQGVLQEIGDGQSLKMGQQVSPGATLAKIVQPTDLKAEIKIAETQVRDVQIGQRAEVDTRNGVVAGRVSRIDPSVQNGTVTVDIELEGALPKGARPDLSVDGTIELELMEDVLFVGRPVNGQSQAAASVFKIGEDGYAIRVPVKFGRSSVSVIEVVEGLAEGNEIILSDMSQWDSHDRIRIK